MRVRMSTLEIRPAPPDDLPVLLALWERSVRATHGFLSDADIDFYRPLVADFVAAGALDLWVVAGDATEPAGFISVSEHAIEALFLDPAHLRQGWGRRLVAHAISLRGENLTVDVNEQNVAARRFYAALGFAPAGRSDLDETGRPHAVLHLRRTKDGAPTGAEPCREYFGGRCD
jgi:putative acetyltransferase